jgi:hypothetical protein
VQTDLSYVGLGSTRDVALDEETLEVDLDFDQIIWELGGAYRLTPKLDLWVAGRLYSIDEGATFQGNDLRSDGWIWADVYVGLGYRQRFGKHLLAAVRADIGTGASDMAWFANAVVGWEFTPTFSMGVGYRVLSLDYETGSGEDYFLWDITQGGLGVALQFALR